MQELLFEPGETGSKSEYNSPAVCPSPTAGAAVTLTPLRASRRSGRKSSLQLNSPKGEFPTSSVQKYVKSFLSRLPSGTAVDYSSEIASPAAGTTPMRSRSLESTFGLASPGGYGRFTPTSSPGGAALRREVSASPKPAGAKSLLKPLGDNHGSGMDGNLMIRTAAEFFDLINRPAPLRPTTLHTKFIFLAEYSHRFPHNWRGH
ncbi:hypothetical protein T484DRAFT_1763678 [Baffinella frigidus]|nr:hypothetical protein T484DRAFT_1763678 [Cryptophyta sp. CCMP2293]